MSQFILFLRPVAQKLTKDQFNKEPTSWNHKSSPHKFELNNCHQNESQASENAVYLTQILQLFLIDSTSVLIKEVFSHSGLLSEFLEFFWWTLYLLMRCRTSKNIFHDDVVFWQHLHILGVDTLTR